VEPLANIPVLTDLVVDMEEFYERYPRSIPTSARASSTRQRTRQRASPPTCATRTASNVACACRRARSWARPTRTSGRPPWRPLSGCSRNLAAQIPRVSSTGRTIRRSVALPRGLRVHGGLPLEREPGRQDHGAARCAHGWASRLPRRRRRRDEPDDHHTRAPGRARAGGTRTRAAQGDRAVRERMVRPTRACDRLLGVLRQPHHGTRLVFYLYLHLGVLTLLLAGESNWNDFIELATNVVFLGSTCCCCSASCSTA